jgi:hypothetical protein
MLQRAIDDLSRFIAPSSPCLEKARRNRGVFVKSENAVSLLTLDESWARI